MTLARVIGAGVRWHGNYSNAPVLEVMVDTPYALVPRDEHIWRYVETEGTRWVVAEKPILPEDGREIANHNAVGFVSLADARPPVGGALGGTFKLANGGEVKSPGGWSSRAGVVNGLREELGVSDLVVEVVWMRSSGSAGSHGHCTLAVAQEAIDTFLYDTYLVAETTLGGELYFRPSVDPEEVVKP